MRLTSLKLERYGCFTDKELVFRPGASLHLVFGENEAGKSTSLSAITDLLFGIESRTAYDFLHTGHLSLGGTIVANDGQEFSFRRRKGTKNTLLDLNGKAIAEDSLDRYLHGLTRGAFSNAFGMDTESLRAGAAEMLKAGGDSGVSLFAAAAGLRGLAQLQKTLLERSDQIFTPRRSTTRLFYQALERFEAAKESLRGLELKDRDLRELRKGIEESEEQLKSLRARKSALATEREQLRRDKDTAPLLRLIAIDESSLHATADLPSWDRSRIKGFRDAEARVIEMEHALDERTNEEAELTKKGGEYSVDSTLLAQADEIELLFGLTGNYASQVKDLPRVRGEFRGYGQDLANVARRLGIEDADTLSSTQPTDSLVARIKNLAQAGCQLESDLGGNYRTIEGVQEELEKLEPEKTSEESGVDIPGCRQTFEALRPAFGRLPELQRLEPATSNLEQALAEATSQASPAINNLDALAITSLPASIAVEEFSNRFEEDVASERDLRTQEKTASGKVATLKRQMASFTTTPTITWPTPAAITYGTPLGATQLDATSDVRGDFSYAPAAGTILSAGSQTLSVTFTPTEHTADYTTATATVPLIVNKANPTVSVSCAPNPITYGPQNTSCTATVSGSATGFLTWTINGGAWTMTPVTAPTAGGFSGYPVGSYTIAVAYSGDSNNIGSSSSTVLTILPAPTTTTIASSVNPTVLGQNVSWPCSVTSPDGTPTGMITYTLDGSPLGTISTTDAPWSGTGLTVGAHVLSCSFAAQGNFAASSGTVTQAVGIASTVTELSSSANPIVFGGSATFTALVDTGGSVAPTASVAFTSNGVAIGSAVVSTVTTTNLLNNSDVSTWTASGPTLTANASAAPDDTLTATHVVFPANSGCCINIGMTSPSAWIPGDTYTYSVWLRSDSSASVNVSLRTGPGGESDTWPTMTPTWTRYTVSGTVPAGATGNVTALMYLADTPGVDYYAWGAQVEQSATAGPYIATSGAPATGTGGVATLTTTTLQAGSDTIVATYGGDAGTGTSTSNPLIEGVTAATPTITWNNPAPTVYGTPLSGTQLNATASVPGSFTYSPVAGTVLSAGSQTLSVTFVPTDSADYSAATATVSLIVNKAPLAVTPAPASKVYGTANPTFTGAITGLVAGDTIIATYASAATTSTAVGVYSNGINAISATLSDPGDKLANYTLTQNVGTLTITQATTVLTWATPAAIIYETPLSVTQLDATGGGVIGTYVYTPAAGTILTAGTHTLSVAFTPSDALDYSSASATVSLAVNKATPTVVLTSSGNPTVYGGSVTFTAQTATSTTGTMTFYDGAAIIGTGTLSGGVATYTTNSLGGGTHTITVRYGGDSNYLSAVSAAESQIVTRAPVTITVTSSLNPSSFGQSVTFTFTVAGVSGLATPTGTIAFSDGSTLLASPTLNASGVAIYTTVMLSGGSHTLSAVYGGDANYQ